MDKSVIFLKAVQNTLFLSYNCFFSYINISPFPALHSVIHIISHFYPFFFPCHLFSFSKFVVTSPGCIPVLKSWGLFQVKVVSEEQPQELICCDRQCWTVCSSLNSTSDTPALAVRPAATSLWRWEATHYHFTARTEFLCKIAHLYKSQGLVRELLSESTLTIDLGISPTVQSREQLSWSASKETHMCESSVFIVKEDTNTIHPSVQLHLL